MALPFDFADPQDPQRGDWLHFQFANPGDAQHVGAAGFDAATLGSARTSPHLVFVAAIQPEALPAPVVRFRADALQAVTPLGMLAPDLGRPALDSRLLAVFAVAYVSPASYRLHFEFTPDHGSPQRTVHAHSFNSQSFGVQLVDRSPFLRPAGLDATRWGLNTITNKSDLQQSADPLGFVASAYTLPSVSRALRFKFDNPAYLIPPGNDVVFDFVLQGGVQGVYAGLGVQTTFGQTSIANARLEIRPSGFDALRVGALNVNARQPMHGIGFHTQLFGTAYIWNSRQYKAAQGFAPMLFGSSRVEHGIRSLLAQGAAYEGHGTAWVSFGQRVIAPIGIARVEMTIPQIGGLRFLGAAGFLATRWGERIIPESRTLFPLGFAEMFGLAEARNRRTYLRPNGITTYQQPYQHWGVAKAWNLRQYVALYEDPDSALNPPKWPLWTAIANRNRVVGTLGALASVVSRPAVENKARPLFPVGIAAPVLPEFYKAGMVSWRIRPLPLEGIDPPYFAGWNNVANGARVIKPTGLVQTIWGRPTAENTRRSYKLLGFDSAWFGYPLIADRIRTLTFEQRYTIGAPSITLPNVRLHVRYINAHGIDHPDVGRASLDIHWNKIWPKWTHRNFFGEPFLKNRTPELRTRGRATDEYGDALVRLQWRPVAPYGPETTLFGRVKVADRKQQIQVAGADYARMGDKLVVVRTGAPPLALQWIVLDSVDPIISPNEGYGIEVPEDQVPKPITQQQVVYVHEGEVQTRMGRPVVTANSIRVEPGIYELTVGEPMVGLGLRGMAVGSIAPQTVVGAPRLSPHTIWAVTEAPDQARRNHPPADLHYVNSQAIIGNVRIENRHRRLGVYSAFGGMVFGNTYLENRKQYLGVSGFQMLRMGWHTLPGDHIIEVDPMGAGDIGQPGQPVVSRPPYVGPQHLRPTGFAVNPSTGPRVEHFNRMLLAVGSEMLQMGRSDYPGQPAQAPYAWRNLHVGAPMPTIPPGIASEEFGLTWISLRVRGLSLDGFDSFVSEYDYQQFNKRMHVRNGTPTQPAARRVYPAGLRCDFHGTPGTRPGTRYIRPDGNSDQHRKGAF